MFIKVNIADMHCYSNHEFKGNYALQLSILTLAEVYYGTETRNKIESILKTNLSEIELEKHIEEFKNIRIAALKRKQI